MFGQLKIRILILCFMLSVLYVSAQDTESLSFYYNPVLANPALAGAEGPGKLRLSYRDYYPGRSLNLHSLYCSYDSFQEQIHGGYGVYISDNILGGLLNELKLGAAYSYHLRVSRDLYINAGFLASVINRGLNAGNIILPDQIDPVLGPVLPSGETISSESRTVFDAGLGFTVSYRDYHAGVAVNHIFNPDMTGSGIDEASPGRRLSIHGGAAFMTGNSDWSLQPGFIMSIQNDNFLCALGTSMSYKSLSVSVLPYLDPRNEFSFIQSGIHYSTGRLELGYNYNFAPFRSDRILPFTLSNQVYIGVVLNNVEKRDLIKAIKYPKM